MNITLSGNLLRIEWSAYTPDIERQIIERLHTVPGIEGRGRRWLAPIIQFQRLVELFPKASFDYAAMSEADTVARRIYASLRQSNIELGINDSGAVCVVSETSAEIAQYVADRSHALRPFVKEALEQPTLMQLPEPVASIPVQYPRKRRTKK